MTANVAGTCLLGSNIFVCWHFVSDDVTNSYVLQALLFHNTLLPLLAGVLDGRLASMPLTQLTQV